MENIAQPARLCRPGGYGPGWLPQDLREMAGVFVKFLEE